VVPRNCRTSCQHDGRRSALATGRASVLNSTRRRACRHWRRLLPRPSPLRQCLHPPSPLPRPAPPPLASTPCLPATGAVPQTRLQAMAATTTRKLQQSRRDDVHRAAMVPARPVATHTHTHTHTRARHAPGWERMAATRPRTLSSMLWLVLALVANQPTKPWSLQPGARRQGQAEGAMSDESGLCNQHAPPQTTAASTHCERDGQ